MGSIMAGLFSKADASSRNACVTHFSKVKYNAGETAPMPERRFFSGAAATDRKKIPRSERPAIFPDLWKRRSSAETVTQYVTVSAERGGIVPESAGFASLAARVIPFRQIPVFR
jgi:hypothetical protein